MKKRRMRLVVWGLGHVGSVCAGGFASLGHVVRGVERDSARRARLLEADRRLPEKGLSALLESGRAAGRLTLHADGKGLVDDADVSFVCVGAGEGEEVGRSEAALLEVAREIGGELRDFRSRPHVVAIRSTLPVGFLSQRFIPALEASAGRGARERVTVAVVPELFREGRALSDFRRPPFVILGTSDPRAIETLTRVFSGMRAPLIVLAADEAVLFKLVNNSFHALKAGFANEVGRLGDALGVDPIVVMSLVARDRWLGASAAYLKPGFPIGGSCLPRDVLVMTELAKSRGVGAPILEGILPSNERHLEEIVAHVLGLDAGCVGVAGLAFKAGTGDLRGSPAVRLARALREAGSDVVVYDPEVAEEAVPDDLLAFRRERVADVVRAARVVVFTQNSVRFDPLRRACEKARIPVVEPWKRGDAR